MPVGRVAAVALLTYFTMHAVWWNLEIAETRAALESDVRDLEARITELQEARPPVVEQQPAEPVSSEPELTTQAPKSKWFWK